MIRTTLSTLALGATFLVLQACGDQNAAHGTAAPTAAAQSTPATTPAATPAPTNSGVVANFDATLKSSNTNAYISLADANNICQDQVQAITTLTTQLQQQLANGGDVQSAVTQFNTALQALATCVMSQAGDANLPAMGQVTTTTTGSSSCSVSSINGQVTQTGDCSSCQVVHQGTSVSANCSSANAGDANATLPTTGGNVTIPSVDPNSTTSTGSTISSNGCSVSVVNGTPMQSGDCSNCQVMNQNGSVSVSCTSTH